MRPTESLNWYREGESNPHDVAIAGFWIQCVYQFRHPGKCLINTSFVYWWSQGSAIITEFRPYSNLNLNTIFGRQANTDELDSWPLRNLSGNFNGLKSWRDCQSGVQELMRPLMQYANQCVISHRLFNLNKSLLACIPDLLIILSNTGLSFF